jgi:hypothetical protein
MLREQIEAALDAAKMESYWDACMEEWDEGTPEQKNALKREMHEQREAFLSLLKDVDDPETLDMVSAIEYVEVKSRWIRYNTQLQFQAVFKGEASMELMCRAALTTSFLICLEPLLQPEDLEKITDFLSQPIENRTGEDASVQALRCAA